MTSLSTRPGTQPALAILRDENGRSAVSYGIIACLLGVVAIVAIGYFAGVMQPR
jgi:Flp pilus assembly pilin Flp